MAPICLASTWRYRLSSNGWTENAIELFLGAWADSTFISYDRALNGLYRYCVSTGVPFPPTSQADIAVYFSYLAQSSPRPQSSLNTTSAALQQYLGAIQAPPVIDDELKKLIVGIVKTGSKAPMKRSKVMPIQPFRGLFLSWPENNFLTTDRLRLKCITLLALVAMLRPSDAAPKNRTYNFDSGNMESFIFNTDQVTFHMDGSATIVLFGIKNDSQRNGFPVHVVPAAHPKLDPVKTLSDYMGSTARFRPASNPVFLTLNRPYKALGASGVAKVLEKAIDLAGLGGQGYTAKSFRPTGATVAIDNGINPDTVRKIGRWKNKEVVLLISINKTFFQN